MAKETPNDATLAVRAKYSQALMRMQELANSPVTKPHLEGDLSARGC
jgi:hypothetical protein